MKRTVFVSTAFTSGLLVPGHVQIFEGRTPLDLRTVARRQSRFWEYFRYCAFSHEEAASAARRLPGKGSHREVTSQLTAIGKSLPPVVGANFKELERSFELVSMGICRDAQCEHAALTHAHAYQFGDRIPGVHFPSRAEARAWVHSNRRLDGGNVVALLGRIKDWPGMPATVMATPPQAALERQTA